MANAPDDVEGHGAEFAHARQQRGGQRFGDVEPRVLVDERHFLQRQPHRHQQRHAQPVAHLPSIDSFNGCCCIFIPTFFFF